MTGLSRLPTSLGDGPDIFGYAAVWSLFLGALLSLIGLMWPRHLKLRKLKWHGDSMNGLVIEQVGLVGITLGLILYLVAIVTYLPLTPSRLGDVGLIAGLCTAVGAGALWQYATIRRYRADRLQSGGDGSDPHDHDHGSHG